MSSVIIINGLVQDVNEAMTLLAIESGHMDEVQLNHTEKLFKEFESNVKDLHKEIRNSLKKI